MKIINTVNKNYVISRYRKEYKTARNFAMSGVALTSGFVAKGITEAFSGHPVNAFFSGVVAGMSAISSIPIIKNALMLRKQYKNTLKRLKDVYEKVPMPNKIESKTQEQKLKKTVELIRNTAKEHIQKSK